MKRKEKLSNPHFNCNLNKSLPYINNKIIIKIKELLKTKLNQLNNKIIEKLWKYQKNRCKNQCLIKRK